MVLKRCQLTSGGWRLVADSDQVAVRMAESSPLSIQVWTCIRRHPHLGHNDQFQLQLDCQQDFLALLSEAYNLLKKRDCNV